jgi:hypothetical protein
MSNKIKKYAHIFIQGWLTTISILCGLAIILASEVGNEKAFYLAIALGGLNGVFYILSLAAYEGKEG